jgi:hypothetical protein
MSWVITPQLKSVDGVPVGTPYGGGYVAGYISHTADGSPTHALIVAPRATGATGTGYTLTTSLAWKTAATATAGTVSTFDGAANTAEIVTAGIADHPAAEFCVNLSIGGFTDWYLPARYELDIAYFNLKPGTGINNTTTGINEYSVPKRTINFTANYPSQTSITAFATTAEAFLQANHWTSSQFTASVGSAFILNPLSGFQTPLGKTTQTLVRAFRRIAL